MSEWDRVYNGPLEPGRCIDCGTIFLDGKTKLRDEVWPIEDLTPAGVMCIPCLEVQLGRRLEVEDLTDDPCNDGVRWALENA
jgi:hypothetical protein